MSAANLSGLLVAAALLTKSGLFGDLLPGAPPTTKDEVYGIDPEPPFKPTCPDGQRLDWDASARRWVCIPKL